MREEIATEVTIENLQNVYSWFHPDRPHIQVVIMAYVTRIKPGQNPRPNCSEVREVAWMTIDEALHAHIISHNKIIFNELKAALNR